MACVCDERARLAISKGRLELAFLMLVPLAMPRWWWRIALARDPVQYFLLSKPEIGLNTNIWDEPTLHVAVDRFHVDPEKFLEFSRSQDFREIGEVRLSRST